MIHPSIQNKNVQIRAGRKENTTNHRRRSCGLRDYNPRRSIAVINNSPCHFLPNPTQNSVVSDRSRQFLGLKKMWVFANPESRVSPPSSPITDQTTKKRGKCGRKSEGTYCHSFIDTSCCSLESEEYPLLVLISTAEITIRNSEQHYYCHLYLQLHRNKNTYTTRLETLIVIVIN